MAAMMQNLRLFQRDLLRSVYFAFLILPFLLTALIGPGSMLAHGDEGWRIQICTEDGLQTVMAEPDGASEDSDPHSSKTCPWALAHSAMTLSALAEPPLAEQRVSWIKYWQIGQHQQEAPVLPMRAARAPPYLI